MVNAIKCEVSPEGQSRILVDRSIGLEYPDWVTKVMYPDLEKEGPKEYDLVDVGLWFHDEQERKGRIIGHKIHEHFLAFEKTKPWYGLSSCLGLRDALEIQKKGYNFFGDAFGARRGLFFWKSVVLGAEQKLFVPGIHRYHEGGLIGNFGVELEWRSLDEEFYYYDFAPRFEARLL
jgi:hypothetical protein